MSILDEIAIELANFADEGLVEPDAKAEGEETVVGTAPLETRKLYALWMRWERFAAENMVEYKYSSKDDSYLKKAIEFDHKAQVIRELFWISLKDAFNLWGKHSVGIRQNWTVVWFENENPLRTFMEGL